MEDLANQNFEVNLNEEGGARILKHSFNALVSDGEDVDIE